jgi:hypothetical protein
MLLQDVRSTMLILTQKRWTTFLSEMPWRRGHCIRQGNIRSRFEPLQGVRLLRENSNAVEFLVLSVLLP